MNEDEALQLVEDKKRKKSIFLDASSVRKINILKILQVPKMDDPTFVLHQMH